MIKSRGARVIRRIATIAFILLGKNSKPDAQLNRSHERYRLAAMTGFAGLIGRAISFIVAILTVRLTFRYLGAERYGMWMTITSVVTMFGFADLGMSNGIINLVAEGMGRERVEEAKRAASSSFWILCLVAAGLLAVGSFVYPGVNFARVFNVRSPLAAREAGPALAVFALCFIVQLPLGSVRGTQAGLQKGFINNLWATLGTLASLIALLLAIHFEVGLPLLVLCIGAPPAIAMGLNGVELFFLSHPELRPTLSCFSSKTASTVLHTGLMYFILQISISIGVQTDNVVIAQIMGAKAVADYAVPARMFNLVTSFLVMLSGVMLPAYADAFARKDSFWIRRTFFRVSVAGTIVACIAAACLAVWGNRILALWVGPQMHASTRLLLTFAALSVVYAYLQPINFLLNGVRAFKVPVICAIIYALANLGLSIVFVKRYGIIGAVLGTLTATVLVQTIPLTITAQRILRSLLTDSNIALQRSS
jgi:O-antigen/teichoic acid export membrane protein